MTLKDKKVRRTIKGDGNDGVYDIYYYRFQDVEQAVLEFENHYKYMIKKYPAQKIRFQIMLDKHKEIFGNFTNK